MTEAKDPFKDPTGFADALDDFLKTGKPFSSDTPESTEPKEAVVKLQRQLAIDFLTGSLPYILPDSIRRIAPEFCRNFETLKMDQLRRLPPGDEKTAIEGITAKFIADVAKEEFDEAKKISATALPHEYQKAKRNTDLWSFRQEIAQAASEL